MADQGKPEEPEESVEHEEPAEPDDSAEPEEAAEAEEPAEPDRSEQAGEPPSGGLGRQLRRYGPVAAIVVVIAVIGAVVVVGGGSDDDEAADEGLTATGDGYAAETEWGETYNYPEGVIPFSVAEREGLDIDWPETCDTERGKAAVPTLYAPECFAPFEGDNGGETEQGVTEDTIKVVLYQGPEEDPVADIIFGDVSGDSSADIVETIEEFLPFYNEYYETYGREVELVVYEGTAGMLDEEKARADAAQIAEEIKPFAVMDGPLATPAFSDELAARGILNIVGLGGSEQPEYYEERDPYLFHVAMSVEQTRQHLAEYIGKRLADQPAEHAGDESLARQERKFGLVYLGADPSGDVVADEFEEGLADYDVEFAVVDSYESPLEVTTAAPGIISKMKSEGVTSVVLVGDPRMPEAFTRTATDQEYFPEWIVGGSPGFDSAAFARGYDQEQWANAFGVSFGAARQDPAIASQGRLFRWYTCNEPPAPEGVELSGGSLSVFFAVLQGVGPNLTHEAFRDVIFYADPTAQGLTTASLSYGPPERRRWDEVDYHGIDDATEIWWDPEAEGPDEANREGTGLYQYVEGGKHYLPGEWPETPPAAFEEEGAVDIYEEPPAEEVWPDYPAPCE